MGIKRRIEPPGANESIIGGGQLADARTGVWVPPLKKFGCCRVVFYTATSLSHKGKQKTQKGFLPGAFCGSIETGVSIR